MNSIWFSCKKYENFLETSLRVCLHVQPRERQRMILIWRIKWFEKNVTLAWIKKIFQIVFGENILCVKILKNYFNKKIFKDKKENCTVSAIQNLSVLKHNIGICSLRFYEFPSFLVQLNWNSCGKSVKTLHILKGQNCD